MRRLGWLAPLAAAALVGCAATAPPGAPAAGPASAVRPALTAWHAPLPLPQRHRHGEAASRPAWAEWQAGWSAFDDPLLPALIAAAQDTSPSLAAAAARIERARAAQVVAGAAGQPQLAGLGTAAHGREALGQPVGSRVTLGLQAGWELDLFGAVAAGREAATARLQAAQAGWFGVRVALAAEVASTYTALRACEAHLGPVQADAASRAETARLTGLSEAVGFIAPADAALVRAGAAQARINVLNQRAACDVLVKALVEVTAWPEPELRQRLAAGSARVPQPAPLRVDALPAALLAQRPDLIEAERAVLAAAGDAAQSQARERPQITLSGSLAGVALHGSAGTARGATWAFGPLMVNFPLFDGGARGATSAAARASYDEAVALYQGQVRRAVREVESALVAWQSADARQTDAQAAAVDFERSLRATEARQRGGLASLLDLETARRNALAAQSALLDLQRERTVAWISLYRALGGGWSPADAAPEPGWTAARP